METEIGCGVATHNADCLCDVVIRQPLPPLEECLKDGVRDMWFGREVCDIRGYGYPWDNHSILNYFEDLVKFYDAFHYNQQEDILKLEDMEVYPHEEMSLFVRWAWIRDAVQYAMNRFDNSLHEIIVHLNIEPQDLMDALTTGKGGTNWTYSGIKLLDIRFMETNLNFNAMARDLNLTLAVVRGLRKYWDNRRKRQANIAGSDNPARDRMQSLCRNTTLNSTEIIDIVHQEFGVLYSKSSVCKTRQRLNK